MSITRLVSNIFLYILSFYFKLNYYHFNTFSLAVDKFYIDAQAWIVWTFYFVFLKMLYISKTITHFLCKFCTHFCEWKQPDSNRRLSRVITKEFTLKSITPMITIDQRYMLLSGYILHQYLSFFSPTQGNW